MSAVPQNDRQPIRARVIILACLLVPVTVFHMVWGSWARGGASTLDSLFSAAVAGLLIFTTLNMALKQRRPGWALSGGELIALYVVLVITIGISAGVWDWGGSVATVTAWPIWNAGPDNRWQDLIWPNLPMWLTVGNRELLRGFFAGDSSPYRQEILLAWVVPAAWWTSWTVGLLWVSLCLNVIVRRRWSQEEQLPFPIAILPLQMIEARGALFRSPVWWAGVSLSAGISVVNLLASYFPVMPSIRTSLDFSAYIANNPPWDSIRAPVIGWHPLYMGLAYLMPTDLAFSVIVFNLLWRAEYIVSRLLGWSTSPWSGFPYGDQQSVGGYLALMAAVVWLDRHYLAHVLRKAFGLPSLADDSEESFSYRTAVWGAIGGLAFLWYFLCRGGMSYGVSAAFLILYFMVTMALSRVRAHLGPPNTELYGAMPEFVLTQFPGTRALGPRALGLLALMRPYMGEQRTNPAPAQLEALRMAERTSTNPSTLAWLMMLIVPVAMVCYFWASVHYGYHTGLGTSKSHQHIVTVARDASVKLDGWLRTPAGPDWAGVGAIGVGFLATIVLMAAKLQFPAWPLHPLALSLSFCWPIDAMLPAIIVTWLTKALLLKYGGLRAHRRALPLFLGLIVGGAVVHLVTRIVNRIFGLPG